MAQNHGPGGKTWAKYSEYGNLRKPIVWRQIFHSYAKLPEGKGLVMPHWTSYKCRVHVMGPQL